MAPVDVAIVGAGAAGLATAIFAARRNPSHSIVLIEGARRPGAKILVSGGGRCNVTNSAVTSADFWGTSRASIRRILAALPVRETVAFFREIGVALHEEADGKLFPDTNSARTVLDALLAEARARGVRLDSGRRIESIRRDADGFSLGGNHARRVVLATGGRSLPKSGSDGTGYRLAEALGHTIVSTTPGLAPLLLDGDFHVPLSGVSQDVELTVRSKGRIVERIRGAMLWTHFGVSGPAPMNASRVWLRSEAPSMTANLLPGDDFGTVDRRLQSGTGWLAERMPSRVAEALVGPGARTKDERRALAHRLVEFPLPVKDSRGWNHAEVTAGGVPLNEIDPRTMESRRCPGLFLVGEILDADGRIGGFNFQWAWSGGFAAGSGLGTIPA